MGSRKSNKARVGEAFDLLSQGLEPFIDVHMQRTAKSGEDWTPAFVRGSRHPDREYSKSDPSFQISVIIDCWKGVFERQLPRSTRNLLFTLRDVRNDWAHNKGFADLDAQFALGGIVTILEAVDATQADNVRGELDDLSRAMFEKERAKAVDATSNVVDKPGKGLRPWREVVLPHSDVASGDYAVAEFAADLELVRHGRGSDEYADPVMFFERTYLTAGLRDLLTSAIRRVSGNGGQPVINCQTNFGGGKTHSLIALYHLFSGIDSARLPSEVRSLIEAEGVEVLPSVRRAVVVGNRFAAGEVHRKSDGIEVNTIWGEIAWQLGGADGYELIASSDQNRTNPGDLMREVFERYSPCIVLIDEWVAYARELYAREDLPGGTFDSQFGFAQALTEATRATPGAFLVVSIPASEGQSEAGQEVVSDLEVGGHGGREALRRLTNVVARQAENWQPARGDESFEIVRRRLFQPLDESKSAERDAVAEAFGELYRTNRGEFPAECAEIRYVDRIKSSYPIHPELFDRLYREWSTVDRFQRTRGVLRLMAAVIESLWRSEDRSPLILPCSIPLDSERVNAELTSKLDDQWRPVIDADVDGPNSRPAQIDRDTPHLGAHHATRRIARTIFFDSAPTVRSANRGIDIERIRVGSVFAGERPAFIADALNRLTAQAPHLYVDRDRYWFDLQENVNRLARDESERLLSGDKHEVHDEIIRRIRAETGVGDFRRVHPAPATSADVVDDAFSRLVVLRPDEPHVAKTETSHALTAAREIVERRGNHPRIYKNMVVFAACDQRSIEALEQSAADYLAWKDIGGRVDDLNLDAHQRTQATTRRKQSDEAIGLRLVEAYQYAIVPRQDDPVGEITFDVSRLDSQGSIAQRVSRRLVNDGALATQFPPIMLRLKLENELASMWEDGDITVSTLWEAFATYVYLQRLRDQDVLISTVENGPASTTWQTDGFAVASAVETDSGRYLNLTVGSHPGALAPTALVVKPEFALGQIEAEKRSDGGGAPPNGETEGESTTGTGGGPGDTAPRRVASRFHGSVRLDGDRPVPQFMEINKEVLDHLITQIGTDVELSLTIKATRRDGFEEQTIRVVTENARTLNFDDNSGFERD